MGRNKESDIMSSQATMEPAIEIEPALKYDKQGNLVTSGPGHVFEKFVTNIRLKARETRQILIGSSSSPMPPKGFAVELKPQKMPEDTIVTRITAEGSTTRYDYILDITNCSNRSVSAQVWQI
jgi:hypothetical protein